MRPPLSPTVYISLAVVPAIVISIVLGHIMTTASEDMPIRSVSLPLFNPHMPDFDCSIEAAKLIPIDAQAEAWFFQAQALENPQIFLQDRDPQQVVHFTRLAAQRNHWKAMINLASLFVEGKSPSHDTNDAVKLIEKAMELGIPAAYDRMGTYYKNATGVQADATRAYALWQRAALMGNPEAMAYLGERLGAAADNDTRSYWANRPVSMKMLACSVGQGYGQAAYFLMLKLKIPALRDPTKEEKEQAFRVLHHGVRLGCEDCANDLSIEFSKPFNLADMLAPFIDKARAERYALLGDALFFDRFRRFPNLDRVLPLPPAALPPWNGDRDTLVRAAMGVSPVESLNISVAPPNSSRFFVPPELVLRKTDITTKAPRAPHEGYWRPLTTKMAPVTDAQSQPIQPGLYKQNEPFSQIPMSNHAPEKSLPDVTWEYWVTAWHAEDVVEPRAPKHLIRHVARPKPFVSRRADETCTRTGTWQPWLPATHPLAGAVNQHWRQAWVVAGQPFPQPKYDWWLDISATEITWHLMDDAPVNINTAIKE
ncbi:hypothetical protein SAMN05428959_10319 [Duganella sp. CF517]|uniref:tetratricopeptide repeat protein n=1 Tax=Duganella sp. CF517 TaxID=1881038 RepID=UPI0008AEE1E6|nr:tetratricopeptide repeat protein [Duganella sp. CF517]SEN76596.1 hypothetical protein SAMN05428959_10319 [Duganella sp. CF517]